MKKKINNKRLSINKIAHIYNRRSRACAKCPVANRNCRLATFNGETICDICSKSFVEGFTKGVKFQKHRYDIKPRGFFDYSCYNSITTNNRKYSKD